MSAEIVHISVLVSNDLVFDQRVRKVCGTLVDMGFELTLIGRKLPDSAPLERPYTTRRFRLPFTGGALFYASLNIRLFFYLLGARTDVILANDLDTLPAAWLVAKLRGKQVVYDSHEYFTEAAGLTGRNFQKKCWLAIERRIFPKLTRVFTVNETIAEAYRDNYGVDVRVLRNVPPRRTDLPTATRAELGLPETGHLVILQGAFLDPDRGAWEAAQAITKVPDAHLLLIGAGQEWDQVQEWLKGEGKGANIIQLPRLPFEELQKYTALADLGLSLDKPDHLNYRYSLPNKLFDYIQMRTPVVTTELPELLRLHRQFAIGKTVHSHDPAHVAAVITEALNTPDRAQWDAELARAAEVFNWEAESEVIREVYGGLLPGNAL